MGTLFLSIILVMFCLVSSSVKLSGLTLTMVSFLRSGLSAVVFLPWCSCMEGSYFAFFLILLRSSLGLRSRWPVVVFLY